MRIAAPLNRCTIRQAVARRKAAEAEELKSTLEGLTGDEREEVEEKIAALEASVRAVLNASEPGAESEPTAPKPTTAAADRAGIQRKTEEEARKRDQENQEADARRKVAVAESQAKQRRDERLYEAADADALAHLAKQEENRRPKVATVRVSTPDGPISIPARQYNEGVTAAQLSEVESLRKDLAEAKRENEKGLRVSKEQEERMARLEGLALGGGRSEDLGVSSAADAASTRPAMPRDANATVMLTAQLEASQRSIGEMELRLGASEMQRRETIEVHRAEKETIGKVITDLELQLADARDVRLEMARNIQSDKETLTTQLRGAEERSRELKQELAALKTQTKSQVEGLTAELREREKEVVTLNQGGSIESQQSKDNAARAAELEGQVRDLTRQLTAQDAKLLEAETSKKSLAEGHAQLQKHVEEVQGLNSQREQELVQIRETSAAEMDRMASQLGREEKEALLELERARADKEFLRNEIAFYKRTVADLNKQKDGLEESSKEEKEVLNKVIQDLEEQMETLGQKEQANKETAHGGKSAKKKKHARSVEKHATAKPTPGKKALTFEKYTPDQLQQYIAKLFDIGDKDKNGTLEIGEMRDLLSFSGFPFDLGKAEEVMKKCDKNGDGVIDHQEFAAMMRVAVAVQPKMEGAKKPPPHPTSPAATTTPQILHDMSPVDRAANLSSMPLAERADAFHGMSPEDRAASLVGLSTELRTATLAALSAEDRAQALHAMAPADRKAALAAMPAEERASAEERLVAEQDAVDMAGMAVGERASALAQIPSKERGAVLAQLSLKEKAAPFSMEEATEALGGMSSPTRAKVLATMPPKDKAAALASLPPSDRAAALADMGAMREPPAEPERISSPGKVASRSPDTAMVLIGSLEADLRLAGEARERDVAEARREISKLKATLEAESTKAAQATASAAAPGGLGKEEAGELAGLVELATGANPAAANLSTLDALRKVAVRLQSLLDDKAVAKAKMASTQDAIQLQGIQHEGDQASQGAALAAAEAEVQRLVREGAEDRRQMTAQMGELQRVMEQLKTEKEQYYFQSKQDKEVTEQILSDLQAAFQNIVDQREASLAHAQAHHDVLGEELYELRTALEKEKREKELLAEEMETESMTHTHVTATLEAELASQLRDKTKLEAEVHQLKKKLGAK